MERRTSDLKLQIEALKIAEGYFGSQVRFATNPLGVFERLASSSLSLAELPNLILFWIRGHLCVLARAITPLMCRPRRADRDGQTGLIMGAGRGG